MSGSSFDETAFICDPHAVDVPVLQAFVERALLDPAAAEARQAFLEALKPFRPPAAVLPEELKGRVLREGLAGLDRETLWRLACDAEALRDLHAGVWASADEESGWPAKVEAFLENRGKAPAEPRKLRVWLERILLDLMLVNLKRKLKRYGDVRRRLAVILRQCRKVLNGVCAAEIGVVAPGSEGWLRVLARSGQAARAIPYLVPQEFRGRALHPRGAALVEPAQQDPDFQKAVAETNPVARLYPRKHWRDYRAFLQRIHGCYMTVLERRGKVVGALCLYTDTPGVFTPQGKRLVRALAQCAAAEVSRYLLREAKTARLGADGSGAAFHGAGSRWGEGRGAGAEVEVVRSGVDWGASLEATPAGRKRAGGEAVTDSLRALGTSLARKARNLTGAYRSAVRIISPIHGLLVLIGHAGRTGAWPEEFLTGSLSLEEEPQAGHALATGQSYYLPDTAQRFLVRGDRFEPVHYQPVPSPAATPQAARSHASVVLRHRHHLLGLISVDWDRRGGCEGRARHLLELLARRYAVALKDFNIDVLSAELDDVAELDRVLGAAAREGSEPNYHAFLQKVCRMVGARQGAIFVRRAATGQYHAAASLLMDLSTHSFVYEPGEGVTGWVIKYNRPVRIADLRNARELRAIYPADPPVWLDKCPDGQTRNFTYLGVPISVDNEVFGVLRVADNHYGFTGTDQQVAMAAASRLAGLLQQRERARRTKAWIDLASSVARAVSQEELAGKVFEALGRVIGTSTCWVRLLDQVQRPGAGPVPVLARLAVNDPRWQPKTPRFRHPGEGIAGKVMQTGRPLVLHDTASDCLAAALREEDPANDELLSTCSSVACVPIHAAGELVGTLLVCRKNRWALMPWDLSFVQAVSDRAGYALRMVGKAEELRIREELDGVLHGYLMHLVWGYEAHAQEKWFLTEVYQVLMKALGGHLGAVWAFDAGERCYRRLAGTGLAGGLVLPQPRVLQELNDQSFLVVSEPAAGDARLLSFADAPGEGLEGCPRAAVTMAANGEPQALFLVAVPPNSQVSYNRIQRVAGMLEGAAHAIVLCRQSPHANPSHPGPPADPPPAVTEAG
jgi:GAF domain-containing protein